MHVFVEFMLKQCIIMLLELGGCDFKARFKGDFSEGGFLKFFKNLSYEHRRLFGIAKFVRISAWKTDFTNFKKFITWRESKNMHVS